MTLDVAIRLTEILLGIVLIQQSLEQFSGPKDERIMFGARILLCVLLLTGFATKWVLVAMVGLALVILRRFQGPYNGGSDKMGLLALCCLTMAHWAPNEQWREYAFAYLGGQLTLSYFISGWVKVVNPKWRSGQALQDVFRFSAYPVSEHLRHWAQRPNLLRAMSWGVMGFELLLPLCLLWLPALIVMLVVAATFHLANACLFGLNRFFWTWLSIYPAIIWLQQRIFG